MRRANEIILVIAAAGLAAVAALIGIPTHSADPGTVVGVGIPFPALPSTTASTLPPLAPFTLAADSQELPNHHATGSTTPADADGLINPGDVE